MTGAARTLALAAVLVAAGDASAASRPRWTALADCAGAYVANSRVADANRPAAMASQMDDVAQDYARAARRAVQRRGELGARRARGLVARRIEATAQRLSRLPREAAEKVIDACPQPGG